MSTKLDPKLRRIALSPGRTGRVPLSSSTGIPTVNDNGTMRLWSGHRMVFQMPFHPPSNFDLSNCQEFKYYPIFRFPTMGQTDNVKLSGRMTNWVTRYNNEHTPAVRWYPDYVAGTPGASVSLFDLAPGTSESVDYGDNLSPWTDTIALEDFYIATAGGAFKTALLETDNMLPAAVAIFRAGPSSSPAEDWRTEPADCAYGKPLRSYDSGAEGPGLGQLIRRTTRAGSRTDYLSTAVASPLFAWGHHHGIWTGQGKTGQNIFGASGAKVKIIPRPIFSDSTQPLTVAVVYSAGAESTLTVNGSGSASGTASATLTVSGNPRVKEVNTTTLACSTSTPGDLEFLITTPNNSATSDWCIIHSVSVYPDF